MSCGMRAPMFMNLVYLRVGAGLKEVGRTLGSQAMRWIAFLYVSMIESRDLLENIEILLKYVSVDFMFSFDCDVVFAYS